MAPSQKCALGNGKRHVLVKGGADGNGQRRVLINEARKGNERCAVGKMEAARRKGVGLAAGRDKR
jgi:hypothetical protein